MSEGKGKEKRTGLDIEGCAAAYDELVANDWHLQLEEEYTERILQEKQAVKRKKKAGEEVEKKKQHKSKMRRRVRRSGF